MRILVIQTAFIGDVVLTTPFLAALRVKWPTAELHVVTTRDGAEVLAGFEGVRTHMLDKKGLSFARGIRVVLESLGVGSFDVVFSVHRSLRSLWLGRKAPALRRVGFRSFTSRLLGYETVAYPPYQNEIHYAEKPMALLGPFGEVPCRGRPQLAVLERDVQSLRLKLRASEYIILSPFSVWGTKMWFADRFARLGAELSKRYDLPIVIIGSSHGREVVTGQTIAEKIISSGGQAISVVGNTGLGELKALIRDAKLVVANDSAPVHIASAFNIPTVAIFGPTVRKWGFFPLSERSAMVERVGLECRPCHLHGPQRCPKRHFRCMNEIQVEDVARAVEQLHL